MTRRILFTSNVNAVNRRSPKLAIWLTILALLVIILMGCAPAPKNEHRTNQTHTDGRPTTVKVGFEKTDCGIAGITFPDITISYNVDDPYDGPYLICNSSSEGTHNLSVHYYMSIIAFKADKLDAVYQELQANIQGFVDQSTAWNALPNIPANAKDEITFIRNDRDGYVFMITSEANVQECENGRGYGAEKVMGKYLVNLGFQSCELADAAAYTAVLKSLETAALTAIQRVEGIRNP